MKADVLDLEGNKKKTIELPKQFSEEVRFDLIKRAILSILSKLRHPYGASPEAGKRHSTYLSKRRRNYRGIYGHGFSRTPRKILWRRGMQFGWIGGFVPQAVGGRRAHPPKAEKNWVKKINKKERKKAIRSALSSIAESNNLIIVEDKFEELNKTKEVKSTLEKLNLKQELERLKLKKIRSGKGKSRGRKYKKKQGPLIVVSKEDSKLNKAAKNLQGFDIVKVNSLNARLLTSGEYFPRKAIFTESSINKIQEGLFSNEPKRKNK